MHDPVAADRHTALRAIGLQAVVVAVVAAAFLVQGPRAALSAATGGGALVVGHFVALAVALGGGIVSARVAFARLLLGIAGKWLVVVAVLAVASGAWRLAPLPMLAGLVAGLLAYHLSLNFIALNFAASKIGKGTSGER